MVEAWQKRGYERQELLAGLLRKLFQEEERREDPTFLFKIAQATLAHLQQRHHNAPRHDMQDLDKFFGDAVFLAVHDFARSQAEEDALVFDFLEKVIERIGHPFHAKLRREEFDNPEVIFRAPSAMAEVPIGGNS